MVGVSRTGVESVVMQPSLLSGILTAVIVKLTLEAASLVLFVVLWVVTVPPPPDTTEAVVKGSGDEVTLFAVEVALAAAWERVNMSGGGGFVSRCENFLRVTWSDSLTNIRRWRHFKR